VPPLAHALSHSLHALTSDVHLLARPRAVDQVIGEHDLLVPGQAAGRHRARALLQRDLLVVAVNRLRVVDLRARVRGGVGVGVLVGRGCGSGGGAGGVCARVRSRTCVVQAECVRGESIQMRERSGMHTLPRPPPSGAHHEGALGAAAGAVGGLHLLVAVLWGQGLQGGQQLLSLGSLA